MTVDRVPPHLLFVVSAVFHYLGPAFAVLLFVRVDVLGGVDADRGGGDRAVALAPALASGSPARPRRARAAAGLGRRAGGDELLLLRRDRPVSLGTVAAIEFLPVIALAAVGARTPRNLVALLLAVPGVYLLTGVRIEGEALGLAFAFANAALFALYIVLAHRVARLGALGGIDGLAASMLVAIVVVTPMAGWAAVPALTDPVAIAAGVGVGISRR